jgi:hypothetical protein
MSYLSPVRVFLLSFLIDRDAVTAFLDTRPEIVNWRTISPYGILVASRTDLTTLSEMFHTQVPWLYFLLVPVEGPNANGWWSRDLWDFINSPKSSGRWPD